MRRLGSVDVRPTRRWAAAHERRRVRVVAKSKRVPEFVSDNVADDVGHRERLELGALDCDEAPVADARAERDELCAGEADKKISSEAVEWRWMLTKPSASEHPAFEPAHRHRGEGLQLSGRELACNAVDRAEPKSGTQLGEGAVPEVNRLFNHGNPRVSRGRDHGDLRDSAPSFVEPAPGGAESCCDTGRHGKGNEQGPGLAESHLR